MATPDDLEACREFPKPPRPDVLTEADVDAAFTAQLPTSGAEFATPEVRAHAARLAQLREDHRAALRALHQVELRVQAERLAVLERGTARGALDAGELARRRAEAEQRWADRQLELGSW